MKKVLCIALALVMVLGLAACGGTTQPTETKQPDPTKTPATEQPSGGTETPTPAEPTVTKADLGIEPLIPDGETILNYSNSEWATVTDLLDILTDEDLETVKSQNLTAVICMHENASYWSQAFIAGITSVFEKLNIEILSVTDAGFAVESMITNVENAVSLKPDLMIVYVLDSGAMQSCVQSAIDAGIKVVYYEAAVDGTEHGTDYIGTVVADNYTISYTCMRLMIEKGGMGQYAICNIDASVTDENSRTVQRLRGAQAAAKDAGVEVIDSFTTGATPDTGTAVGEAIVMAYPDILGIWGGFDELGIALGNGANALGFHVLCTGPDMMDASAYSMATDGAFAGCGTQSSFESGLACALAAVIGAAGKDCPERINTPCIVATKENLKEAWELSFRMELPSEVAAALAK